MNEAESIIDRMSGSELDMLSRQIDLPHHLIRRRDQWRAENAAKEAARVLHVAMEAEWLRQRWEAPMTRRNRGPLPVLVMSDAQERHEFPSANAAARFLRVSPATILKMINKQRRIGEWSIRRAA